jgi:hypothetical protein
MGGSGSTRWGSHSKKDTVEDCSVLSIRSMVREGLITSGQQRWGSLVWRNSFTGEERSSVSYQINTLEDHAPWLRLFYTCTRSQEKMDYRIILETTRPHFGGIRWWFVCPLVRSGKPCARRAAKLYLPPGGRYFGCRLCYDLTYESCQESHKFDSLFASIAAGIPGATGASVKQMLSTRYRR